MTAGRHGEQCSCQAATGAAASRERIMKMAKLYEATGALVAGIDKKKAARQAASVASAAAWRRNAQ
jgi:hypothetical protein